MKLLKLMAAFAVSTFALCACSSGEYSVDLATPTTVVNQNSQGPKVVIAAVTDNRQFIGSEQRPDLPSGKILSPEYKARAYARLKNALNEQSGALLLPEGKTVASVVRGIIIQAFSDSGYNVIFDKNASTEDAMVVAVSVNQFWTYAGLKNMNDDIKAQINIDLYIQTADGQKRVNLKNTQTRKVLTDTKTLYKTTTEASLANIYYLAVQKIQAGLK